LIHQTLQSICSETLTTAQACWHAMPTNWWQKLNRSYCITWQQIDEQKSNRVYWYKSDGKLAAKTEQELSFSYGIARDGFAFRKKKLSRSLIKISICKSKAKIPSFGVCFLNLQIFFWLFYLMCIFEMWN